MFEKYFISIGPFIDCFKNFNHFSLHDYPLNTRIKPMFCQTLQILVFASNPNLLENSRL